MQIHIHIHGAEEEVNPQKLLGEIAAATKQKMVKVRKPHHVVLPADQVRELDLLREIAQAAEEYRTTHSPDESDSDTKLRNVLETFKREFGDVLFRTA